jgi:heterodisulfide reductase subunit A-like polyferredoxin
VAAGPKDIVDTIVEADAAAMEASKYMVSLNRTRKTAA